MLSLLAEEWGIEKEALKYLLKQRFLSRKYELRNGRTVEIVPSFADLSTEEMSRFIEDVTMLAAEYGILVPPLSEVSF